MPDQISGKDAYVDGVPCIQSWGMSLAAAGTRYQASCTNGGTVTTDGNKNFTGQASGVGLGGPDPSAADVSFRGVASDAAGDLQSFVASIRWLQTTYTMNIAGAAPITWASTFGVQGAFTEDNAVAGSDSTLADASSSTGIAATIGASFVPTGIQSASVVVRRAEGTYVKDGLTYRNTGNIEADVSLVLANKDLFNTAFEANAVSRLRLIQDGTTLFDFGSIKWQGPSSIVYDRNNQSVVQFTLNGQWQAVNASNAADYIEIDGTDLIGASPT